MKQPPVSRQILARLRLGRHGVEPQATRCEYQAWVSDNLS